MVWKSRPPFRRSHPANIDKPWSFTDKISKKMLDSGQVQTYNPKELVAYLPKLTHDENCSPNCHCRFYK